MRVSACLLTLLVITSTGLAPGQDTPTAAPSARRSPDSLAGSRFSAAGYHSAHFDEMNKTLRLDEKQQRRVTALLKAADEDIRNTRLEMQPAPDVSRRMTQTVKEIQEARAAGDSKREKDLVEERAAITRGFIEKRDKSIARLKGIDAALKRNIAETLRPDQAAQFEEFWAAHYPDPEASAPYKYTGPIRSALALKAATDRLEDLTPQQKSEIEAAFKTHQETTRTASTPDAEEPALRALYTGVFTALTEGQRQRVQQELSPKDSPAANPLPASPAGGAVAPPPKSP